jgi:hypothetical protein
MSTICMRWRPTCILSIALCALTAATGCRRSDTVSASGHVTLDGAALPTGTIAMIPSDKNAGPSVGCEIVEGRYSIPAARGPLRGAKYRVEIRSVDPASGSTKDPLSGTYPVFRDRVPAAYNAASQLTLSVPDDAANLEQDFNLDSRARK